MHQGRPLTDTAAACRAWVRARLAEQRAARVNELVQRRGRGGRQGATVGQLDCPGYVADGHEPVSFTLHGFLGYIRVSQRA